MCTSHVPCGVPPTTTSRHYANTSGHQVLVGWPFLYMHWGQVE